MKLTPCESSNIAATGHDPQTSTLRVQFKNGGTFDYAGVDAELYERMRGAPSIGRFFHAEIKGSFSGAPVPPPGQDDTQ